MSLLHVGDILQASDNLSRVINSYKKIIEGQAINGEVDLPGMSVVEGEFLLILNPAILSLLDRVSF